MSHPIQYISPLMFKLSENLELEVYYYSDIGVNGKSDLGFGHKVAWDIPLLDNYKFSFLKNWSPRKSMDCRFWDAVNFGVWGVLRKSKGDIVMVNSWTYCSDLMVIFVSFLFSKKVWIRAENPLNQELHRSGSKVMLKRAFLKYFLFKFFIDKFLYIGSQNKLFYEYFGVSPADLIFSPYAVDNLRFSGEYSALKPLGNVIKSELCIPEDAKVVLYVGKLIEKKRPFDLLKAFEMLNSLNLYLVFVGDGPLRSDLERDVVNNNLSNVIFTGFINQTQISRFYTIANVLVVCSGYGETWGLVVNEALNFDTPIILSETTGCNFDLINHGVNGFVFEEGDCNSLSYYLNSILSGDFDFEKSNELTKTNLELYSLETNVNNIKTFVNE